MFWVVKLFALRVPLYLHDQVALAVRGRITSRTQWINVALRLQLAKPTEMPPLVRHKRGVGHHSSVQHIPDALYLEVAAQASLEDVSITSWIVTAIRARLHTGYGVADLPPHPLLAIGGHRVAPSCEVEQPPTRRRLGPYASAEMIAEANEEHVAALAAWEAGKQSEANRLAGERAAKLAEAEVAAAEAVRLVEMLRKGATAETDTDWL